MCASAPSELLALIALRNHDRLVARSMGIVLENIAFVNAFFDKWQGLFEWIPPQGGVVGFPLLNSPIPVDRFAVELVQQESVLLLPGDVFTIRRTDSASAWADATCCSLPPTPLLECLLRPAGWFDSHHRASSNGAVKVFHAAQHHVPPPRHVGVTNRQRAR